MHFHRPLPPMRPYPPPSIIGTMGRTIPTYRLHLESILNDWMDYRRALREKDRETFDRVITKARQHASAASYCAHMDPTILAILSVLLEMEKEKDIHMNMHTQNQMAKNVALADDVYESLQKEKREGESFSDVIRRMAARKPKLTELFGVLADVPEDEFQRFRTAALSVDRPRPWDYPDPDSGCRRLPPHPGASRRLVLEGPATLSPTPPRGTLKDPDAPGVRLRGESAMHGWIIDAYGDYDRDSMVLWLWNERGAHRIEDPRFLPTFYLHATPAELPVIRRRTEILDGVREVREVPRRLALEDDEPKSVLESVPRHYRDIRELAHILDSNGGYIDHRLYNVDLRFSQRYAMDHGLFPMGLVRYGNGIWTPEEEHFALEYPLPPLNRALLDLHVDNPAGIPRMQDKLLGARIDGVEIDGSEEDRKSVV